MLIPQTDEGEEEEGCSGAPSTTSFWNPEPRVLWPTLSRRSHKLILCRAASPLPLPRDTVRGSSLKSLLPFQKNVGAYGLWFTIAARFSWPQLFALSLRQDRETNRRLMLPNFTALHTNMNSHKTPFTFICQAVNSSRFKVWWKTSLNGRVTSGKGTGWTAGCFSSWSASQSHQCIYCAFLPTLRTIQEYQRSLISCSNRLSRASKASGACFEGSLYYKTQHHILVGWPQLLTVMSDNLKSFWY